MTSFLATLGAMAAARGAFLGLITYATYDLTNLATLKDWSLKVTLVDIAWGTVMTAAVAGVATWLTLRIG